MVRFPCESVEVDLNDVESLQRGSALFVNYCMGCHSAKYMRWGRLADDLGISEELALENLVLSKDEKIGALMSISMSEQYGKNVFGASPPDLTLVSRVRSPRVVIHLP